MPKQFTYLPILKWKRGEQQALQHLPAQDKASAMPLIEILPESVEDDDPTGSPPKDAYAKIIEQISKSWGTTEPIFVELGLLEPGTAAANNAHPVAHLFNLGRSARVQIVPVTSVYRDAGHQAAVASVIAADKRGACIRITPEDIAEQNFAADIQTLLSYLNVAPADVDVVLDSGYISVNQLASIAVMAVGSIATLPHLTSWRSLSFAASSFPELLTSIGVGVGTIRRAEWDVWLRVTARLANNRPVIFGDYGATHPIYVSTPYPGSANIRYTIDDSWLIFRGRKATSPVYGGYQQFVSLSQQLIADPHYLGHAFSWGDDYIHQCSQSLVGTGNMTTWRAVATNHHITFVLRQLANPSGASASPAPQPLIPRGAGSRQGGA
jgi:hypothetical protein